MKIVVFAGSRMPKDEQTILDIKTFAQKMAQENFDIVYGGGNGGVMGLVATEAQKNGSHVTAVVVDKYAHEKQLDNIDIYTAKNDLERFEKMMAQPDVVACIVFPGGPGTVREAFSALEKAVYEKGVPILLPENFSISSNIWNTFQTSLAEGFINQEFKGSMKFISQKDNLTDVLNIKKTNQLKV